MAPSLGAAQRVWTFLDDSRTLQRPPGRPAQRARAVTYRYPGASAPALDTVDCDIAPGSLVAVVGPSGSGKSTLLHVLAGLAAPESGQLDRFAPGPSPFAFQNPVLFAASTAENVDLGHSLAAADIARALERAGLDARFAGRSADGGAALSGGERRRLSVARAVACPPAVLFLDESTANLDPASARAVWVRIESLGGVTRIVATHRLDEAARADQVVVMRRGRVVEAGRSEASRFVLGL